MALRNKIVAAMISVFAVLAFMFVNVSSAQAASAVIGFQNTCTSQSAVTMAYRTDAGTYGQVNVPVCTNAGEVNGNTWQEPRGFYISPGWCASWYYQIAPFTSRGETIHYCNGGSNFYYVNTYFGDGAVDNYWVKVTIWR